jgi:hypothetical protein
MESANPIVLKQVSLHACVEYVLDTHKAPSLIVYCGTKDDFIYELLQGPSLRTGDVANEQDRLPANSTSVDAWAVPTLRLLASSRMVKMVFCPDITHLRAYLATLRFKERTHPGDDDAEGGKQGRLLVLLNPIRLHRPTSAFSAQGLNRTFSAAVEAAHHAGSKLVIAECEEPVPSGLEDAHNDTDQDDHQARAVTVASDVWDEEVSILNVTTKSFGVGDRGWVGRTVKLSQIAARWCTFENLPPARV